jgi:cysteine desulfurase
MSSAPSPTLYLDHAATTPLDERVSEAMATYRARHFANPNSLHTPGQDAAEAYQQAKATIARCLNAHPDQFTLTSGGTEANNLALLGLARALKGKGKHLVTSAVEHSAVLAPLRYLAEHEGFELTVLPVDSVGRVSPAAVADALRPDTILASIMHANNEVGTLQPIAEMGELLRAAGVVFHVDAVQTVGKLPLDLSTLPIDALSCSAHKFYGPKGVGFLYLHPACPRPVPLQFGGSQEAGLRGGTTPVELAIGLATALELVCAKQADTLAHLSALTTLMIDGLMPLLPPQGCLNTPPDPAHRVPGIVNVCLPPRQGDQWVMQLAMRGIAVASGSACHAGQIDPSHVLLAMGRDPAVARCSVRFSMGRHTTADEVEQALAVIGRLIVIQR